MLLTMAKIVFKVVTLSLESIIILIFHFPSGTTSYDNLWDVVPGNGVVGGKGIFISYCTIRASDGKFTPIDRQSVIAILERNAVEIAVSISFFNLACPTFGSEGW